MAKKQSTKKRTQVKDLPKKDKKLSKGDMKKVKGGSGLDCMSKPPFAPHLTNGNQFPDIKKKP
jgi:hypothetical protein